MISRFSALVGLESTWLNYLSLPSFLSIAFVCRCCLVTKSCLTLCDPMDCSLPGSSSMEFPRQEHWEWIAISSSRGSSQPRDRIHVSCVSCIGRQTLLPLRHLGRPRFIYGRCLNSEPRSIKGILAEALRAPAVTLPHQDHLYPASSRGVAFLLLHLP